MRAPLLLAVALAGCSAIGHHRVAGPPAPDRSSEASRPRVMVIVVDGLRQEVLARYVDLLEQNDWEPDWPSGLALLARSGFRLAGSRRAEAPAPAYGMAPAATLATGHLPDGSGVPGSVFFEARSDGTLVRHDFDHPAGAARVYYGDEMARPAGPADRPLLARLLRAPTLYERLALTHRAAVVFHPFGAGAEWLVPSRPEPAVTALLPHRRAAAVASLFDRGARNGAVDLVLSDDPPDLLTLYFRGVLPSSCHQHDAVCAGTVGDLPALQSAALRGLDRHLHKVLSKLEAAHPEIFEELTLLFVGTGGVTDRTAGDAADTEHALTPAALLERLAAHAPTPACAAWLRGARAAGELAVAVDGAAAHLYVPPAPLGGRDRVHAHLTCLSPTVEAAVQGAGWLAGATWIRPEAHGEPPPRGRHYAAALHPAFEAALPAGRRDRVVRKLRRIIDDASDGAARAGDAVLFAAAPWIFVDPRHAGDPPFAAQGGLEDAAMRVPFLVASRRLSGAAASELRAIPVELAEVAPTVITLLEAPGTALAGLPRPPVLRWRAGGEERVLELVHADRQLRVAPAPDRPSLAWHETAETVRFGLEEPKTFDEPDAVTLRLGDLRFAWTYNRPDAFGDGADCAFDEDDDRRAWRCTVPLARDEARVVPVAIRREPAAGADDGADVLLRPVALSAAPPTFEEPPSLVCADESALRIRLVAGDDLGLARATVLLVEPDALDEPARVPGDAHATVELGSLEPSPGCAADPLGDDCRFAATAPRFAGELELPLAASRLRHRRRAWDLPGGRGGDVERLRRVFFEARGEGAERPPRRAFLAVRVCDVAGRCVQRPLASDRDYFEHLERGCP